VIDCGNTLIDCAAIADRLSIDAQMIAIDCATIKRRRCATTLIDCATIARSIAQRSLAAQTTLTDATIAAKRRWTASGGAAIVDRLRYADRLRNIGSRPPHCAAVFETIGNFTVIDRSTTS
jgi:hypothetical protein